MDDGAKTGLELTSPFMMISTVWYERTRVDYEERQESGWELRVAHSAGVVVMFAVDGWTAAWPFVGGVER
jgi:hypothetical protein